jgi:DNA-binding protein HU-beta
MTKAELIENIALGADMSKVQATLALNAFIESVSGALVAGDSVAVSGLGTFSVKERAARKGRNPQTGAELDIKASRVVGFKLAKPVKDAMNK